MYLPVGICWYLQGRFIFLGQAPGSFPLNARERPFSRPFLLRIFCHRNINLRNVWLQRTAEPSALAAQLHSTINHEKGWKAITSALRSA